MQNRSQVLASPLQLTSCAPSDCYALFINKRCKRLLIMPSPIVQKCEAARKREIDVCLNLRPEASDGIRGYLPLAYGIFRRCHILKRPFCECFRHINSFQPAGETAQLHAGSGWAAVTFRIDSQRRFSFRHVLYCTRCSQTTIPIQNKSTLIAIFHSSG